MEELRGSEDSLFLELSNPFALSISTPSSDKAWGYITELAQLHGLLPLFYYRVRSLGLTLPESVFKELKGSYLYQLVMESKARRQLKEVRSLLAQAGISMILLKGASAMLRLYPSPGLRTLSDLDILIPIEKAGIYKQAMLDGGYEDYVKRVSFTSPEDWILRRRTFLSLVLPPLAKDKALIVDPHIDIIYNKMRSSTYISEMWMEKEEIETDGILMGHLSKEHFIIHSTLHLRKDLLNKGFVQLKGLVDVLCAIKQWEINWPKLWATARRWNAEKEILSVMATLNYFWHSEIPLPEEADPFDLHIFMSRVGRPHHKGADFSSVPAGYVARILRMRELSGIRCRLRYLYHLFSPVSENMRWRYKIPAERSVLPYYLLHLFVIGRRFILGLIHQ